MSRFKVWYQLQDPSGNTLGRVDYVLAGEESDLVAVCKVIKSENPDLTNVPSRNFVMYHHADVSNPLQPDTIVSQFTTTAKTPLIVRMLASNINTSNESSFEKFVASLKRCQINNLNDKVLDRIISQYPQNMLASIGRDQSCWELYQNVKSMPQTSTRALAREKLNLAINGPLSAHLAHILSAFDLDKNVPVAVKVLRVPERMDSKKIDNDLIIQAEIQACNHVNKLKNAHLVPSEVVELRKEVQGLGTKSKASEESKVSEESKESKDCWQALKMPCYLSTLADCPQLTPTAIARIFDHISSAIIALHGADRPSDLTTNEWPGRERSFEGFDFDCLVHMDIKSANVFIDHTGNWILGDFGSARGKGADIYEFTQVFMPINLVEKWNRSCHPSIDWVLLCIMIAVELDKENWSTNLCDPQARRVDQDRISNFLKSYASTTKDASAKDFVTRVHQIFDEELSRPEL